jgi:hypothetical protein
VSLARQAIAALILLQDAAQTREDRMMRTKTEITIETERVLIVRRRRSPARLWCNHCARVLSMLTLDELSIAAGISSQVILELAEAGGIHLASTTEDGLFICPNSPALETEKRCS